MSIASLCQHRGTVYRLTTSKDSAGGTVNAYAVRATMTCLIRAASSSEVVAFASQQLQVSHVIVTEYSGTAIGDKFVDSDGQSYEIRGIWRQRGVGNIGDFYQLNGWQLL